MDWLQLPLPGLPEGQDGDGGGRQAGGGVGSEVEPGKAGGHGVALMFAFLFPSAWINNYIFILTGNQLS